MDREPNDLPVGKTSAASPLAMVTVTCNLGGERQMQMAINISAADPVDVQNTMLDGAMQIMDRQKARYDLEKVEEQFRQVGMNLRNMLAGLPIADNVLSNQVASITAQLQGKSEGLEDIRKEAYDEHAKSGRRGAYKADNLTRSRLTAVQSEIDKLKMALEAAPRDAAQEREKLVNSILRYQEDMVQRRKQVNDLRRAAGLDPNEDFMAEQTEKV